MSEGHYQWKVDISGQDSTALLDRIATIPGAIQKASIRASNDAAKWGKTRLKDTMVARLGLRPTVAGRAIGTKRANKNNATALLFAHAYGINLIEYRAAQNSSGVAWHMGSIAHAFVSPGVNSGKKLVFLRTGTRSKQTRGRYAGKIRADIKAVQGPLSNKDMHKTLYPTFAKLSTVIRGYALKRLDEQVKLIADGRRK